MYISNLVDILILKIFFLVIGLVMFMIRYYPDEMRAIPEVLANAQAEIGENVIEVLAGGREVGFWEKIWNRFRRS